MISIIIPISNGDFKENSLQSFNNQSLKDKNQVQIILVADNDNLSTVNEYKESLQGYKNIDIIKVPKAYRHEGGSSRNFARSLINMPYVTYIDDDDSFPENYLSTMIKELKSEDKYDLWVISNVFEVSDRQEILNEITATPKNLNATGTIWGKIYPSYYCKKNMINPGIWEDTAFTLKYFGKNISVKIIEGTHYNYHKHLSSFSKRDKTFQQLTWEVINLKQIELFSNQIEVDTRRDFIKNNINFKSFFLANLLLESSPEYLSQSILTDSIVEDFNDITKYTPRQRRKLRNQYNNKVGVQ